MRFRRKDRVEHYRWLGTVIIDEKWRFVIKDIRLRNGETIYRCEMAPPFDGRSSGASQLIVYGEDGTVIKEGRHEVPGWSGSRFDSVILMLPFFEKNKMMTPETW